MQSRKAARVQKASGSLREHEMSLSSAKGRIKHENLCWFPLQQLQAELEVVADEVSRIQVQREQDGVCPCVTTVAH